MPESIFTVVMMLFYASIIGFLIFIIFNFIWLSFKMYRLRRETDYILEDCVFGTEEEKAYKLYLKKQNFKSTEYDENPTKSQLKVELELCEEFIKQNPDNLYAINNKAFLFSRLKEHENAIATYKLLIEKAPDNFDYVSSCANEYISLKDLRTALNLINNYYQDKEKDDKYFAAIGDVLYTAEDYNLAIVNYTKAIELKPTYHFYYTKRGVSYKKLHQIDKYEEDKKKSLEVLRMRKDGKSTTNESKTQKTKKEDKINLIFIIKTTIFVLIVLTILYFHPTQEVLRCDTHHNCKVEQTYFNLIKLNKKINITPNSNLSCSINMYAAGKRHNSYGLYIRINSIAPFVFYVANSYYSSYEYQKNELSKKCNFYHQSFIKYLNNYGKYRFILSSKADAGKLYFSLFVILIFFIILFQENLEKLGKKLNQNKKDM
ncbi:MAG: tetratricopeptide repeat protein [Cyanobacteria bacterium SIG27]|nr:tetratricopeptide repeat protein [Cyanobacteria bacterium SIG27]